MATPYSRISCTIIAMRCALLVYNPKAGKIPPELLTSGVVHTLQDFGSEVAIEASRSGEHITRLARQAAQAGLDALFIVGGDGSVGKAASGLMGSRTALGVLPGGTANVWALEIGLHRSRCECWRPNEQR